MPYLEEALGHREAAVVVGVLKQRPVDYVEEQGVLGRRVQLVTGESRVQGAVEAITERVASLRQDLNQ